MSQKTNVKNNVKAKVKSYATKKKKKNNLSMIVKDE